MFVLFKWLLSSKMPIISLNRSHLISRQSSSIFQIKHSTARGYTEAVYTKTPRVLVWHERKLRHKRKSGWQNVKQTSNIGNVFVLVRMRDGKREMDFTRWPTMHNWVLDLAKVYIATGYKNNKFAEKMFLSYISHWNKQISSIFYSL